jgi:hypothetical protein
MIGYVKLQSDSDKKEPKVYHCLQCGAVITHSDALIPLNGAQNHSFTNPAGVRCNFMTFSHCDNVLVHEELFLRHSWFPGYGWRFLVCSRCLQHLGWKYDAVITGAGPETFYGVLIDAIETVSETN